MTTHHARPAWRSALRALALFAAVIFAACQNDAASPPIDESVPDVRHLLVVFAPFDSATGRAGSIVFDPSKPKMFYEFNAVVPTPDGTKTLPTFEYYLHPDADIYAPADGYVTHFKFQTETGDYEIGITRAPTLTSSQAGMVMVDHVRDITVSRGAFVTAGQVLGKPGPWIEGVGRTELMVYGNDSAYCPFLYTPDSLKAGFRQRLRDLMADWEAYKGDSGIYDEAAMVEPGCNGWSGIP